MRHTTRTGWAVLACAAFGLASAAPALAGDSNTVYIQQDSSLGGIGNTIYVDQSAATGSRVGGISSVPALSLPTAPYNQYSQTGLNFPVDLAKPAQQLGGNNSASITDTGENDSISLYQNNSGVYSSSLLNQATISLGGSKSSGIVIQSGSTNTANLTVSGPMSTGGILQQGDSNTGRVNVSAGAAAFLVQNGSRNTNSLDATGPSNSQISYIVNGNGLVGGVAQVVTNSTGAVKISQSNSFKP